MRMSDLGVTVLGRAVHRRFICSPRTDELLDVLAEGGADCHDAGR